MSGVTGFPSISGSSRGPREWSRCLGRTGQATCVLLAVLALATLGSLAHAASADAAARSIRVTFTNNSTSALTRTYQELDHGCWATEPPSTIAIGQTVVYEGESCGFATGVEWQLNYQLGNGSTLELSYDNPFVGSNSYVENAPSPYAISRIGGGGDNATILQSFGCCSDGIPADWKKNGVTIDPATGHAVPSGTPGGQFIDLPHMGVSLDRPNVLVQMDWMQDTTHNQQFEQAAIDKVIEAFNNDPVTYPGATRSGITLIVDNGSGSTIAPGGTKWGNLSRAAAFPWTQGFLTGARNSGYDTTNFNNLLKSNFIPTGRAPIFHYAVAVADISSTEPADSTSGFTPNGYGFIASLGKWPLGVSKDMEEGGTFMHELGHVLGFGHGGEDSVNEKPNYPSIMNYFYDPYGVDRNGEKVLDYSREAEPTMNETTLTEMAGLNFGANPLKYEVNWWCPTPATAKRVVHAATAPATTMDWSCDGTTPDGGTGFDVNGDNSLGELSGNKTSDWQRINFITGGVGTGAGAAGDVTVPPTVKSDEITTQISLSLRPAPHLTYSGALSGDYHDPVTVSGLSLIHI